ncbi:hypothetical protein PY793_08290 [Acetobacter fabarum]|uniref:ArnT family glycosyltransferase n=1 Tax=Acetobacter fabarum TaxID=483199 RepID=UPI00312BCAB4
MVTVFLEKLFSKCHLYFSEKKIFNKYSLTILCFAIVSRIQIFGNPLLDSDEGFYLLVGERMLHGALPYVDIWDRKPIGLFLLYAGIGCLGGGGVWAYQLVGTVFVFLTGLVIAKIARYFTTNTGATLAAIAYLIWLTLGSANGGQAEIFYGLPVAIAALITLRGWARLSDQPVWLQGSVTMLLLGIAMQIKYTVVFEGVFFGCCWLYIAWRAGLRILLPVYALFWIFISLSPTLAAIGYYFTIGQVQPFIFANFSSIWQRSSPSYSVIYSRLKGILLILLPLLFCIRIHVPLGNSLARTSYRFTLCWLLAAIFGFLIFGTYLEQYLLPIIIPASIAASPFFGREGKRRRAFIFLGCFFLIGQIKLAVTQIAHGSESELSTILQHVDRSKCLFVYSGVSTLYRMSGACIPTPYAFPSHLSRAREEKAIGIPAIVEVKRIMLSAPGTVIIRSPYKGDENWEARALVLSYVQRDYTLVFHGKLGWQDMDVYRLK